MQLRKYQIITLSIFFLIACIVMLFIAVSIVVQIAALSSEFPFSISTSNMRITPTPFQPSEFAFQLEDGSIEFLPQPENTPTPVPTVAPVDLPKDQINILLLGSDFRPNSGYRTDVILLLSVNPDHNSVSIVSFPRDLFVQIPGWEMNRINTAHQVGGFNLLADTFEYNFGIHPDFYVMVDFAGFERVIDSLGGIDVNAEKNLSDVCDGINSYGWCNVGPGIVHMDSSVALWYARARHSTSDFDRTRRAQEVVQAIFNKLMTLNALTKVPELYGIYSQYVETNLSLGDILPYLSFAASFKDTGTIQRYVIGPNEAYDWTTDSGAMVLIPDYARIHSILVQALYLDQ